MTFQIIDRIVGKRMQDGEVHLERFHSSTFRAKFGLSETERQKLKQIGFHKVEADAEQIITARLAPANPPKDGKQTPFKGHPVFKAQHATATCCRGCLAKWHKIPKGHPLTSLEVQYVVAWIMAWIEDQIQSPRTIQTRTPKPIKATTGQLTLPLG